MDAQGAGKPARTAHHDGFSSCFHADGTEVPDAGSGTEGLPRRAESACAGRGGSDLCKIARPELERLSDRVKETINLSILVDNEIFYLDKVETQRSITCSTRVGGRVAAHATSCGKILLADRDADFLAQYCEWMKSVPPLTPKTITQPDRLLKELESARINGYAMDDGEVEQGLICVAAPVRDASGRVIAAVSIAGPDYRMEQDMEMMIHEIRQAAERISYTHGFFR